jgi:hypothetical protein
MLQTWHKIESCPSPLFNTTPVEKTLPENESGLDKRLGLILC